MALLFLGGSGSTLASERTVYDSYRGSYFTYAWNDEWSELGLSFGLRSGMYQYDQMPDRAVKGVHGRLQHFATSGPEYAYFPISRFNNYMADELARGHDPLWVTATLDGVQKPVYFSFNNVLDSSRMQAVNIGDERFAHFYVNEYVRKELNQQHLQNWHVGLDNFTIDYGRYGVEDPANPGTLIKNVTWDQPFPQNQAEWISAAANCIDTIHNRYPDVRFMVNEATFPSDEDLQTIMGHGRVHGLVLENFLSYTYDGTYIRNKQWGRIQRLGSIYADKIQDYQIRVFDTTDETEVRSKYLEYLMFTGPNGFCNLKEQATSTELDPALYAEARNRLGDPVADPVHVQEFGRTSGYMLHSREVDGGLIYLNRTGNTKTIDLPAGETWYDKDGNVVTTLVIDDREGDYVTRTPGNRVAKPGINPRLEGIVTGPVPLDLGGVPQEAEIRYTLDGSEPTASSPLYDPQNPPLVATSATVRAKAFQNGLAESFVSEASLSITDVLPTAEFHLAGEGASEILANAWPLIALDHVSAATASVDYQIAGGSATWGEDYQAALTGTVVLEPYEQYDYFHLEIIDDLDFESDETIELILSNPVNCVLGDQTSYVFTIENNDTHPGDFNWNYVLDAEDIDLLYAQFSPTGSGLYDLNGDGSINQLDVTELVEVLMGTQYGDVNLDGLVNEADLAWLADGWKQGTGFGWATGDMTGDSRINEADLAYLADNWKQLSAAAVPEPAVFGPVVLGGWLVRRRR
jgi:hypothetical protein